MDDFEVTTPGLSALNHVMAQNINTLTDRVERLLAQNIAMRAAIREHNDSCPINWRINTPIGDSK